MMGLPFLLCVMMILLPGKKLSNSSHALYISVVQIDHRDVQSDANILVKVFANDLQDAVRASFPKDFVPTDTDAFCSANKASIEAYFLEKLHVLINGQETTLKFLNGTRENDVFWLKFTLKAPENWADITIRASFFMELFSSQSNIIQVTHASKKRFARLTKSEPNIVLDF